MRVLLNDPPRADRGETGFVDLSVLARECDIITFHTPLNRNGKYKTFHLADADFFAGLQRKPFIVNTSRGEVIETLALLDALKTGRIRDAVIDTWENEPDIHPEDITTDGTDETLSDSSSDSLPKTSPAVMTEDDSTSPAES